MNPNLQILIESPDLNLPIQSITISNPNPNSPISNLKSQLFPKLPPKTLASIYFTLNGKPISEFENYQIAPLSTLTLRVRVRGGGGDGGATGAESRDCYLNMYAVKKPDKCDPHEQRLSKWLNCSLSCEPLKAPVVIDKLGNLFNKEALVEALLKKRVPDGFGHIKGLRDMVSVDLEGGKGKGEGEGNFECPITGLEFNGKNRFVAIRGCGHVLSAKAFKEVKSSACLVCRKEYKEEDKIMINGNEEEVAVLRERLEAERGKGKKGKRGNGAMAMEVERFSGKRREMEKVSEKGSDVDGKIEVKKFKAVAPAHATKEVYASIFTSSSKKKDFKETYSCRSLPLGRN